MERNKELKERNPICRRREFLLKGKLISPLLIGSGENQETDMDILVGADKIPFLAGTSLAGIARHFSVEEIGIEETKQLFGSGEERQKQEESKNTNSKKEKETIGKQSSLFFSDAVLKEAILGIRDGVRLDAYKTAEDKANFTMQIVEPDASFEIHISLIERKLDDGKKLFENFCKILKAFSQGELYIGARANRGFGKIKITEILQKEFCFTQKAEFLQWLNWRWDEKEAWKDAKLCKFSDDSSTDQKIKTLSVPLKLTGSIMIRSYSDVKFGEERYRSYRQQFIKDNASNSNIPIIPGSSWMGAIRSRIACMLAKITELSWEEAQTALEEFFGTWRNQNKNTELKASKVVVEESKIKGGHELFLSRTAIDRFTGGTIKGALYSEIPWVEGETNLVFQWSNHKIKDSTEEIVLGLLLWAILDLQKGLLAIGGETAVGRGIFTENGEITLNGQPLSEEKKNQVFQKAINWSHNIKK